MPAARSTQRRRSWRLVAAVLMAVLALGLMLIRLDALPRTPPAEVSSGAALGDGPAARAIGALVAMPGDRDPLAAVPSDFASVMGYTPTPVRTADGTVRPGKPTGECSAPGGGWPFGFDQACKAHDYGYDLLRYAHATGQRLDPEARRQLDAMLGHDLHASCDAVRNGPARAGCDAVVEMFGTAVAVNSWRQRYGNPAAESLPAWPLGLSVPTLVVVLLWHRRRNGRRGGSGSPGGVAEGRSTART
jgi:hypothetical protein